MSDQSPFHNRTSFRPGLSGNPAGRPRGEAAVQKLAQRYTVDALRALLEVARLPAYANPSAKVAAARELLAIGYPGLTKGNAPSDGNALHLHLTAIQQLHMASPNPHLTGEPAIEADPLDEIDAEGMIGGRPMLPAPLEDLPDEALPLWDEFRARKRAREAAEAAEKAAEAANGVEIEPKGREK